MTAPPLRPTTAHRALADTSAESQVKGSSLGPLLYPPTGSSCFASSLHREIRPVLGFSFLEHKPGDGLSVLATMMYIYGTLPLDNAMAGHPLLVMTLWAFPLALLKGEGRKSLR